MNPKRISMLILAVLFIVGLLWSTYENAPVILRANDVTISWVSIGTIELTAGVVLAAASAIVFVLIAWLWRIVSIERTLPDGSRIIGTTEEHRARRHPMT